MNTLLIYYGPGSPSISKMLAEKVSPVLESKMNLEALDLANDTPDLFLEKNLQAYVKRNYKNIEISALEKKSLEKMDRMKDQLLRADVVILIFPMYNFGIPAAVKAWIDSVAQAKDVFRYTEYGSVGLLKARKAIVVPVTGTTPLGSSKDFISSYMKTVLEFMGIANVVIKGLTGTRYLGIDKTKINEISDFIVKETVS